jgi:hypothetical protein
MVVVDRVGKVGEKVLLLAGTLGPENNTPPAQAITLQSAIGTQLCPVVDLAFDLASFNGGSGVAALIAASSCTNPIQPALQKASGIVAIRADSASFTSNPTTTTINSIIGNFFKRPLKPPGPLLLIK